MFRHLLVLLALAACSRHPRSPGPDGGASPATQPRAQVPEADAGWVSYRDTVVTANFPGQPTTTEQTVQSVVGPIAFHMTMYERDTIALGVVVSAVPLGGQAKDVLDGGRNMMLATIHATLLSETPITLAGLPGRELRYMTPRAIRGQDAWGVAHMIYDQRHARLIQAIAAGYREAVDSAEARSFLASVALAPAP